MILSEEIKEDEVELETFEATNNFFSTSIAIQLGLEISKCRPFGVTLGTGTKVFRDGICEQLTLSVQGIDIFEDFFALELGKVGVILGVQWPEKLGNVVINWKTQAMQFQWEGSEVTLKGDPSLKCSKISMKRLRKTLNAEGGCVLIECHGLSVPDGDNDIFVPLFYN